MLTKQGNTPIAQSSSSGALTNTTKYRCGSQRACTGPSPSTPSLRLRSSLECRTYTPLPALLYLFHTHPAYIWTHYEYQQKHSFPFRLLCGLREPLRLLSTTLFAEIPRRWHLDSSPGRPLLHEPTSQRFRKSMVSLRGGLGLAAADLLPVRRYTHV